MLPQRMTEVNRVIVDFTRGHHLGGIRVPHSTAPDLNQGGLSKLRVGGLDNFFMNV